MRHFFTKNIKSLNRIGPHNEDTLSLIIGSVLGDSHLEKRKVGIGTRIIFEQCSDNVEYLMWFHSFLAERGYCSKNKPKLFKRIKKNGKIFYHYRFNSYTFSSFNWIHDMFYVNGVKIIPKDLENYLTPLALAVWFMDDGSKLNQGAKIATNCFSLHEVEFLSSILKNKFNINSAPNVGGKNKGYEVHIVNSSMGTLSKLIKPYMVNSMLYKLNINNNQESELNHSQEIIFKIHPPPLS